MGTRNRKKGKKKNQKKQLSDSIHAEPILSTEAVPKHLHQMEPPWKNLYILIQKEMLK
jgi:hypothetical protein